MVLKYFIDTCVWRDFYEDRIGRNGEKLGDYASNFIEYIIKKKAIILFSEFIIGELKIKYANKDIEDMFGILNTLGVLKKIDVLIEQKDEAKNLSKLRGLPFVDCLFAILARDNGAILITQDIHFIRDLKDIVSVKRPQEII